MKNGFARAENRERFYALLATGKTDSQGELLMESITDIGSFAIPRETLIKTQNAGAVAETLLPAETPAPAPAQVPTETQSALAEILAETLLSYGYKVTKENKAMLRLMLENGIPITKENIGRMNQALKLSGSSAKAMFLLHNNMRMTQANAAQLEGFVSGQTKITNQISNLLATVEQLNDPALAAQLKQILAGNTSGSAEIAGQTEAAQSVVNVEAAVSQQTQQTAASLPPQSTAETAAFTQPTANQTAQPQTTQDASPTQQNTQQLLQTHQPQAQTTQNGQATQPLQPAAAPPSAQAPAQQTQALQQAQAAQQGLSSSPSQPQTSSQISAQAPQTPQISSALPPNLLFHPEDSTPETINNYLNNLRETLTQVQQVLAGRETPDAARVMQESRALEAHIDFTSQIRNQLFIQLPMFHNNQQTLLNLHIYKDAKKSYGGGEGSSIALIALDTVSMGRFETYVQKNSRAVHCQFRLESDAIVETVRNNIHKLDLLLRDSGYSMESFSFLPQGESYTLLNNPTENPAPKGDETPRFDERI